MMQILSFDGKIKEAKSIKETGNNLTWIDVTNITKEEESFLKNHFNLHPLT